VIRIRDWKLYQWHWLLKIIHYHYGFINWYIAFDLITHRELCLKIIYISIFRRI
jgi:hypothetical protein